MTDNIIYYILGAFIISICSQLFFINFSHRKGLFLDDHDSDLPQKMHDSPTPRVGGVGVFLAGILCLIVDKTGLYLMLSSVPAFLAGLFEDLYGNLSPKKRLLIMMGSALLAIGLLNAYVTDYGLFTTPTIIGILISFIAILGLINGANLIDGFNGLLSGVSIIIFCAYAAIAYQYQDATMLTIMLVLAAGVLGFIIFNVPRGLIFMGDGGAYFLGFTMAVLSMVLVHRHQAQGLSPFFVLSCISYPVMEVIFSFLRRGLKPGASPLDPDTHHFHHLVNTKLARGKNSTTAIMILPLVALVNAFAVMWHGQQQLLIGLTACFIAVYLLLYKALSLK
jgi:UDP-GlcNAc:undecaprenyl-phosphate/decaprenyl-phosphate GlcNAc-1-phosphate transferase